MVRFARAIPLASLVSLALADCECGFSTNATDTGIQVFTDLLESDFLHANYNESGWASQVYNRTKEEARGVFGQSFVEGNIMSNQLTDRKAFSGNGANGGAGGLQLTVDSQVVAGSVQSAEVASLESDYFYGTYRAGIKITDVAGTCTAFFWYFNDTQEIDIEFLSAQFDKETGIFPVNLVLQTAESRANGFNAANTGTFITANLPFDPTVDFHEYRFDFLPGRVKFLVDGKVLATMSGASVPSSPGTLILSHWSNGNKEWSEGPPLKDATSTMSYAKAYFNSTSPARKAAYNARCTNRTAPNAVCPVPNHNATFFFTRDNHLGADVDPANAAGGAGNGTRNGAGVTAPWHGLLLASIIASIAWALEL